MDAERADLLPFEDPQAQLERAFIDEFLRSRGYNRADLHALPEPEARLLMVQASAYAAGKLTEVESRAHFVHEIHGANVVHKARTK